MYMGEPQLGDDVSMRVAFGEPHRTPVSMGNPHYVVIMTDLPPAWQAEAAEIGRHHDFKHGINVELVRVKSQNDIEVRFYERGVGETQSSGTGSCASAVGDIPARRGESPAHGHAPGGNRVL